jgi:hypothetical protein
MNLGSLTDVQMGYPFRGPRFEHDPIGGVTVIQMKDIDDTNLLHPETANKVCYPTAKPTTCLDRATSSSGRGGGATAPPWCGDGIGAAVLAAPMLLIRPTAVLPAYLCWFLNAPATQAQLASLGSRHLRPND